MAVPLHLQLHYITSASPLPLQYHYIAIELQVQYITVASPLRNSLHLHAQALCCERCHHPPAQAVVLVAGLGSEFACPCGMSLLT